MMYHPLQKRRTVVPIHAGATIKKQLLISIIEKDAGITIEEFLSNL